MGYCNCLERMHFCWCSVLLILLLELFVSVHGQKPNSDGFINIDCGLGNNVTIVSNFTGLTYVSDDQYINTGVNNKIDSKYVINGNYTDLETLRSFPGNTKSCYSLTPVTKGSKYLVRAIFYYGNYDRLNAPPVFDLYFGVNLWCTVNTGTSTNWYDPTSVSWYGSYEIIAVAPADYIEVCLVNTGHGTPFISVLELRPLDDTLYPADSKQSLNLIRRRDFGSNDKYMLRYPRDAHDRQWESWVDSWTPISTDLSIPSNDFEVPSSVLQTAVVPSTLNGSIYVQLSVDKSTLFLIVIHLAEIQVLQNNSLREFDIYINGAQMPQDTVTPKYLSHSYVSYNFTGRETISVSLKSTPNATLPPIANAWERYTILPVIWLPTYFGDVTAISKIKARYNVSKDRSGDPCVPAGLGWTWVNCTMDSSNVSRITTLNLSSKGLTSAMISDFGSLTALEKLDLSHNDLSGSIPTSLDKLVSLIFLDLSENSNLSGSLPPGLQKRRNNDLLLVNLNGTGASASETVTKKSSKTVIIVIVAVVTVILIVGAAALSFLYLKKHKTKRNSHQSSGSGISSSAFHDQADYSESAGVHGLNFDKKQFTFEELSLITHEFSDQVGVGGFGKVFKGHLQTGKEVAVKVRTETSSQGIKEFLNEVEMLSRLHHKNLVSLVGYCKDSNHIALVYEYMQEGNLQDCIKENAWSVPWKERLRIAYESAQGLEYLHKMCNPPLIHRDVKASNILLTTNLEAKISDFGLVRDFTAGDHVSTQVVGTPGYLDPYYASTSQLTEKSDVYSFGVVLLEIITGKSPILKGGHLTEFVHQRLSKGNIESILDPNMGGQYNLNSIWKVADMALRCTDHPGKRPDMTIIVTELKESLNLEMSNTEVSSMVSEDVSQYTVFSRNDSPVSGAFNSGNSEFAYIRGIMIHDNSPMLR